MQVFIEHEDYQKIAKAIAFIRQNHLELINPILAILNLSGRSKFFIAH